MSRSPQRRATPRRAPPPSPSCCSRRPAPPTTSTATSRCAAMPSAPSSPPSPVSRCGDRGMTTGERDLPRRLLPPPVSKARLRVEGGGRCVHRLSPGHCAQSTNSTAGLSDLGAPGGGRAEHNAPPPGTPSDLARRLASGLRVAMGELSPWRSVLPLEGGRRLRRRRGGEARHEALARRRGACWSTGGSPSTGRCWPPSWSSSARGCCCRWRRARRSRSSAGCRRSISSSAISSSR